MRRIRIRILVHCNSHNAWCGISVRHKPKWIHLTYTYQGQLKDAGVAAEGDYRFPVSALRRRPNARHADWRRCLGR